MLAKSRDSMPAGTARRSAAEEIVRRLTIPTVLFDRNGTTAAASDRFREIFKGCPSDGAPGLFSALGESLPHLRSAAAAEAAAEALVEVPTGMDSPPAEMILRVSLLSDGRFLAVLREKAETAVAPVALVVLRVGAEAVAWSDGLSAILEEEDGLLGAGSLARITGEGEIEFTNADGRQRVLKMSTSALSNGWTATVAVDVSAAIRASSELMALATTDPLTGAGNRRTLDESLAEVCRRRRETGTPSSLLLIDIDHFKRINDTLGHAAGDDVLKELVAICRANVRAADAVIRFGGEEFVVVMPGAPLRRGEQVAERIRAACAGRGQDGLAQAPGWTVSIGVAQTDESIPTPESLLKAADEALYRAKGAGRNRVVAGGRAD